MRRVYLLSGEPGVGKTTIIKKAVAEAKGRVGGFYTEEIRTRGVREGFRIITLDGRSGILAHIDIHSPHQVSKYRVDINSLEQVGVAALHQAVEECDLVIIDEIGKMELFSPHFRDAVLKAVESGKKVLGTIMLPPHPWADKIKQHHEVTLVTATRANRDQVLEKVLGWLKATE